MKLRGILEIFFWNQKQIVFVSLIFVFAVCALSRMFLKPGRFKIEFTKHKSREQFLFEERGQTRSEVAAQAQRGAHIGLIPTVFALRGAYPGP